MQLKDETPLENKVKFTLISPEKVVFTGAVDMVVVPGEQGDFGVLPFHSSLISSLRPGLIQIFNADKLEQQIFTSEGFAIVNEDGCKILSEESIFLEELEVEKIEESINKALHALETARDEEDKKRFRKDLNVAYAKQGIIKKLREMV
jgi:F-type H+-transporting ATPase subunit epsilon